MKILGEDLQQDLPALSDVVFEQLDAVDAHEAKQSVVTLLEVAFAVAGLDRGELAHQHGDQEVA